MPVNASIYGQFAPPEKSVGDYQREALETKARGQVFETNQLALQGQRQKLAEYERATQEKAADDNLLQRFAQESGGDQNKLVQALRGSGRVSLIGQADAMERAGLDRRKIESENLGRDVESENKVVAAYRDMIGMVNDPQTAAQYVAVMHSDPRLKNTPMARVPLEQALAQITQDPDSFAQWKQRFGLGATKYIEQNKPQYITQDLGGTSQITALPGLGGAGTVASSSPITQSANNIATVGATIRGQNLVNDRAIEAQRVASGAATAEAGGPSQAEFTRQFGKAAPGYRWKADGSQEAIPGGPADRKNTDAGIREARQREASVAQADRVIAKVDQALGDVGFTTAGPGSILTGIPGTTARNLDSTLQTIKSNLGFAELQAMRDASPTGGALGAIAVQELMALQATVASLDQGQSPTQLRKSLNDIRKHYSNWKDAVSGKTPEAAKPPSDGKPIQINDDAGYNALPSGAMFVGPDGKTRRKP